MPNTDEIRNEIRKTLSDPTPLYALAGAGDLAYEKLREVPGRVEALAGDRRAAQEAAAARLQEAQAKLQQTQAKVVGSVTTLPTDFRALQDRAQSFAFQQVGRAAGFVVKAKEVYDELAERGKEVVEKGLPGRSEGGSQGESVTVEVGDAVPVDAETVETIEVVEVVEIVDESVAEPKRPAKKAARPRKAPGAEK
ncbi:hypothetical protein [Kitasatospora kifunensis]|uniref:Heparin binding hemagglutinin HbhA n=1 Tax=Kitasatospora kifunensis TaxID=58351 RepID=A0A7W7VWS3_KITKI|nr:hypothetical protein [Kitasatospora kifunensis]MBB4924989.1 hypothetical protein [Kitasatospora kifunensis]